MMFVTSRLQRKIYLRIWYCVSDILMTKHGKDVVCAVRIKLTKTRKDEISNPDQNLGAGQDGEVTKIKDIARVFTEGGSNILHLFEEKWLCHNCDKVFDDKEMLKHHMADHEQSQKLRQVVVLNEKQGGKGRSSRKEFDEKSPDRKKRRLDKNSEDVVDLESLKHDNVNANAGLNQINTSSSKTLDELNDDVDNDEDVVDDDSDEEKAVSDEEFILVEGNTDGVRALQCPKCREAFSDEEDSFEKHVNQCKVFKCFQCGKEFGSEFVLERHVKVFHSKLEFQCDYCVKRFVTKDELAVHVTTWHKLMPRKGPKVRKKIATKDGKRLEEGKRECKQCGEVIKGDSEWMTHMALHGLVVQIQCDVCYKTFESEKQMQVHKKNAHMISYTMAQDKSCRICNKDFHSTGAFNIHMVEKHGLKGNYGCEVCGKQFLSKARLHDHMANHSKERPHICPTCGKTYKTKRNLDDHVRTHLDNEGFPCGKCGKMFKTKQYLSVHLLHTHPDTRRFHCEKCGKLFKTKHVLDVHIEYHLNELNYHCDMCEKRYNTKKSLLAHKQKHLKHL